MSGQEVLRASQIQARAGGRHMPSLGLPVRKDGNIDPLVRFQEDRWIGADSAEAVPYWTMWAMKPESPAGPEHLGAILEFCRTWAGEKPKGPADIVYGPFQGGWFVAVCKKTGVGLGWKSLAFVIPPKGLEPGKSLYAYSNSVNWLESRIRYNLYPRLPSYLQEIIEEMTATELLCPYQEFDQRLDEGPDHEVEYYEQEEDQREIQ